MLDPKCEDDGGFADVDLVIGLGSNCYFKLEEKAPLGKGDFSLKLNHDMLMYIYVYMHVLECMNYHVISKDW